MIRSLNAIVVLCATSLVVLGADKADDTLSGRMDMNRDGIISRTEAL